MTQLLKNSEFNPLTEEEFNKYISLLDTTKISEKQKEKIVDALQNAAQREPFARADA